MRSIGWMEQSTERTLCTKRMKSKDGKSVPVFGVTASTVYTSRFQAVQQQYFIIILRTMADFSVSTLIFNELFLTK